MFKLKSNKILLLFLILGSFLFGMNSYVSAGSLKGKILIQVEKNGEAWYVNPDNDNRYYLGRPMDAFNLMRELGLGISETNYNLFLNNSNTALGRLSGKILLRVEKNGEAYYVNPNDFKMHYMGRPSDAFNLMRELGLGITNANLNNITIANGYGDSGGSGDNSDDSNNPDEIACTYENKCELYRGVEIIWGLRDDMFPDKSKDKVSYTEIDVSDTDNSIKIIKKAMDKYPENIFKGILNDIYIYKKLTLRNIPIGGTYSIPFKKLHTVITGNDKINYEQIFHAELSSMLLWLNYDDHFQETEWKNINPVNFQYGTGGLKEIEQGKAGTYFDYKLIEDGFLTQYAQSSLENDFNSFARNIFIAEENFWNIVDSYNSIKQKLYLIIDLYQQIDPIFTEEYFRRISLE